MKFGRYVTVDDGGNLCHVSVDPSIYRKHRRISPHSQISRTPSLAIQILEKKNLKEIKINQKWSLDKDVLHVNALFLQVS